MNKGYKSNLGKWEDLLDGMEDYKGRSRETVNNKSKEEYK